MSKSNLRVWTIQAEKQGSVQQILKQQAGFTKKEISRAKFLPDGIRKNGIRCRVTETVVPGDLVEIQLEEEAQPFEKLIGKTEVLDILYEDQDLLAVNKPAGLVTHPQGGHYEDTLANQVQGYYAGKKESHIIRPVGRLDKDTSGIVIFAKNKTAAARLQRQRERGEFQKTYLAVTETGRQKQTAEEKEIWTLIDRPMAQDPENHLRMILIPYGKPARTWYRILWEGKTRQLLALRLETGRTHQIRLHMASCGTPLLGDPLYGGDQTQINRSALHAWQTTLRQPYTGAPIHLTAPIPEDIQQLLL